MHEIANSEKIYEADLVLIALGFTGPGKSLAIELGLKMDMRSNFLTEKRSYDTNIANVYAAGGKTFSYCNISSFDSVETSTFSR